MDGIRDLRVGSSSRSYRFSAKVKVVVDADTGLAVGAARLAPGTTADTQA